MVSEAPIGSATRGIAFVFKLILNAFCFAAAGAIITSIIGAANGLWSGGVLGGFLGGFGSGIVGGILSGIASGSMLGIRTAVPVGAASGAVAFFLARLIGWNIRDELGFLIDLTIYAAKGATVGTLVGGLTLALNAWLYMLLVDRNADNSVTGMAFYYGVIGGFIFGVFIGATRCAVRGQRRQRAAMEIPPSVD